MDPQIATIIPCGHDYWVEGPKEGIGLGEILTGSLYAPWHWAFFVQEGGATHTPTCDPEPTKVIPKLAQEGTCATFALNLHHKTSNSHTLTHKPQRVFTLIFPNCPQIPAQGVGNPRPERLNPSMEDANSIKRSEPGPCRK